MSETLRIALTPQELRLQLLTLQSQLKFHEVVHPTAIESLRAAGLFATADLHEGFRRQHVEALQQSIDGISNLLGPIALGRLEIADSQEELRAALAGFSPEYLAACGIV